MTKLSLTERPRRRQGRPKATDLLTLEAVIMSVSRELFFSQGYSATTMHEVAQIACMSKTTLYSRYPSKADLFRAVVATQSEQWGERGQKTRVLQCDTLEQMLRLYGELYLTAGKAVETIQLQRLIISESQRMPELAEAAKERIVAAVEFLAERIADFAVRDGIACNDPVAAAERFHTYMAGWLSKMVLTNTALSDQHTAWLNETVEWFLKSRPLW